ncbi:MAG: ABC transporter transmembrane domain-containing protein [Erysipelotrichaceae bacterium]|nr:ABC transporter transmembrane domain-containing protein [Erysipelotrichaceae bacterium]
MTKEENKKVLKKNSGWFLYKFIASLLIRAFLLVIPIYYSYLIDELTKGNFNASIHMLIMFFVFTMLYRFLEIINQISYYKLYSNLYKTYLDLGFTKTINNSLYSLSRFSLSEYSNIMSEDFETLSDYYATLVMRIVEIIEAIYIVIYFFTINIIIGYITLFVALLVLFILLYYNPKIAKTNNQRKIRHDKRISLFQELLLSVKEIKGFSIFEIVRNRTNETVSDYVKWNNKLNIDKYSLKQISLGIIDIFQVIALFIGIKMIMNGNMTIGVLTIIYSYYAKLSNLFLSIITLFESRINVLVARSRIHKLFQYAISNYSKDNVVNDLQGKITFQNVLYGNKQDPILNDVSFIIDANTYNVITGVSGSGKTGILDLLLRYNRQHEGIIKIDDKDISTFDNKELAKIISAVRKSPTFFNISIRDNLSIFDSNFENIVYFCKLFNIHDYIMGLENGYDTVLLTDASNINSDVKYILAIIKVLLKRPKIMLFDEVFDFLSKDLSEKILEEIKKLKGENTIIIISKNKNIIKDDIVDQVIVLENNKILATGLHQELLKNHDYKKIFNRL